MNGPRHREVQLVHLALTLLLVTLPVGDTPALANHDNGAPANAVIVQGPTVSTARDLVLAGGGSVTHELPIIRAVAARLTATQQERLVALAPELKIYGDRTVSITGKPPKDGDNTSTDELTGMPFNEIVGADQLHAAGIDGTGVTVAVVDTGHYSQRGLNKNTTNQVRVLAQYDARLDQQQEYNPLLNTDENGHGAHVASVVVNSANLGSNKSPAFAGVAPNAELVVVHAFDRYGSSTYADVIRGLQWILDNAASYGIRVVNLSFSAEPRSYYWDDPLNQAVMRLWQAGIVVVASAGNRGPEAMTIGVPGNVPYVITVGAMTDNFTPRDPADDLLTAFSSTGPTVEGFVKPEVVAPGGHVKGLMATSTELAVTHPEFHDGANYFVMSGTSQAAAVVTGVVALMLHQSPFLTPDEVKFRLM
ncbi:MAG: S8 family peptidase, partial [Thermoanaerobaculia bacterium]